MDDPYVKKQDGKKHYVMAMTVGKIFKMFTINSEKEIDSVKEAWERYRETAEHYEPDLVFKKGLLHRLKFELLDQELS